MTKRSKGRPASLTQEQVSKIKKIHKADDQFPKKLIAAGYNVSPSTIYKLLQA